MMCQSRRPGRQVCRTAGVDQATPGLEESCTQVRQSPIPAYEVALVLSGISVCGGRYISVCLYILLCHVSVSMCVHVIMHLSVCHV